SPDALDFGKQPVGSSSGSQLFLVQNTGNAPLDITDVTITGSNAAEFKVTADASTGAHVLPGRIATVSVRFSPTAVGSRSASLAFSDNTVQGQHLVPLTGEGTAPATALNPRSVSFGEQLVGGSSDDRAIVLSNTGSA